MMLFRRNINACSITAPGNTFQRKTKIQRGPNASKHRIRQSARFFPPVTTGLTLVEVLVTLSIVAIILLIGVPSVTGIVERQHTYNLAHALKESMARARTESVKANQKVTVCPSADGKSCSVSDSWETGWIMFVDVNSNAMREENETLLDVQKNNFSSATAEGNSLVRHYVSFSPDGRPQTKNGALQMGTFVVCGRNADAVNVVLSISGNARIERVASGCGASSSAN